MRTSLVTGSSGFIGRCLVKALLLRGEKVVGIGRQTDKTLIKNLDEVGNINFKLFDLDILDKNKVDKLISIIAPSEIYHLAAQSSPTKSWLQPDETMRVNYFGTYNILEAASHLENKPKVLFVSSSSVYAEKMNSTLINEDDICCPLTPYAISKLAAENLASIYTKYKGLEVVVARPFFIIGPGKVGDVCSDWAESIALIERGRVAVLKTGNIEGFSRDFLSVDDCVEGMICALAKGVAGETYNISSGRSTSLFSVLSKYKDISTIPVNEVVDNSKQRAADEKSKIGDNSKLSQLGWRENSNLELVLEEILNYYRKKVVSDDYCQKSIEG